MCDTLSGSVVNGKGCSVSSTMLRVIQQKMQWTEFDAKDTFAAPLKAKL